MAVLANATVKPAEQQPIHYFSGKPVSKEDIDKLLHAAMITPPVIRILPWKFMVIQDRMKLKALSDHIPAAHTLLKAGTGILVCALPEEINITNEAIAIRDCIVASENILSAADELNLAAAWFDIYPNKTMMSEIRAALVIPQQVIPVTLVIAAHKPKEKEPHLNGTAKSWFKEPKAVN